MQILVCGGRDYTDRFRVAEVLSEYLRYANLTIVHGAADGADTLAEDWAKANEVNYRGFPAKWKKIGNKSAGYQRNAEMIQRNDIELVIAFPGGRGTAMMTELARKSGIEVIFIKD
jgi:hypothetical protein